MLELNEWVIKNPVLAYLIGVLLEHVVLPRLVGYAKNKGISWLISLIMPLILFLPLLLLQELAVRLVQVISPSLTLNEDQRLNTYSNIYGLFALIWGIIWLGVVRPRSYQLLTNWATYGQQKENNEQTKSS
jgi:hypothetical protein